MSLPRFQTDNTAFSLLQSSWAASLNPLLSNPLNQGVFIKNVSLISGDTVINHLLARQMQGWIITDVNGASSIYRSKPLNDKTLTLNSSAVVTVNLYCF